MLSQARLGGGESKGSVRRKGDLRVRTASVTHNDLHSPKDLQRSDGFLLLEAQTPSLKFRIGLEKKGGINQ